VGAGKPTNPPSKLSSREMATKKERQKTPLNDERKESQEKRWRERRLAIPL